MVDHFASGIKAASTGARVHTLLVYAGFRKRALRTDHAFGSAVRRRSHVLGQARTNRLFVDFATLAVGSARARLTRVCRFFLFRGCMRMRY